jgi:hypothetical protein
MNIHTMKGTQELQFFHKGELRVTLRKYTDIKRDLKLNFSPNIGNKNEF